MSNPRPPPTAASRRSYFREAPMEEYTPANSIHEQPLRGSRRPGCLWYWADGDGRLVSRVLNAAVHLGLCCMLLAIIVEFQVRYRGYRRRPQAIALTTLVAVDCCLDTYSVIRWRKSWQGWALVLRLLLSLGYIAQFLVYVGFRDVFPRDYAYWGMDAGYSEPVVYLLLWVVGIWDLLHIAIHRHTLGRELRRAITSVQNRRRQTHQAGGSDQGNPGRLFASGVPRGHQRTNTTPDVERGPDSEVIISLTDVHRDHKGPDVVVTSRSGTSWTSGESSSQAGTLARAESNMVSAVTSRRTSTAVSEETLEADGVADSVVRVDSKS